METSTALAFVKNKEVSVDEKLKIGNEMNETEIWEEIFKQIDPDTLTAKQLKSIRRDEDGWHVWYNIWYRGKINFNKFSAEELFQIGNTVGFYSIWVRIFQTGKFKIESTLKIKKCDNWWGLWEELVKLKLFDFKKIKVRKLLRIGKKFDIFPLQKKIEEVLS